MTRIARVAIPLFAAIVLQLTTTAAWTQAPQHLEVVPQIGHTSSGNIVVAASPNGDFLASGGEEQAVKLWNAATGQLIRTFEGHAGSITSIVFSSEGDQILSASRDKTLKLWETSSGSLIRTFSGRGAGFRHHSSVYSVAFSPDGSQVLSGSVDKTLQLSHSDTGELIHTLKGHRGSIGSVAFSPDGNLLLSASSDKTIKLWDARTGRPLRTIDDHSDDVKWVAFAPSGSLFASASYDKTIRIWDLPSGRPVLVLRNSEFSVTAATFSPDGSQIAAAFSDKTLKIWSLPTGQLLQEIQGYDDYMPTLAYSPDGRLIGGGDGSAIRLWDSATGKLVRIVNLESPAKQLAFSPSGEHIVFCQTGEDIQLLEVATARRLRSVRAHATSVYTVAFSPDGRRIVSGGADNATKVWDAATLSDLVAYEGHTDDITSAALTPDNRQAVSASRDRTLKIWDMESGALIRTMLGHTRDVHAVAISPDGHLLVSGGMRILSGRYDLSAIKLWDLQSGKLLQSIVGHDEEVTSVRFSPDGTHYATASGDKTVALFNTISGKLVRRFKGHESGIRSLAFTPDGTKLVSGSFDKTVRLWDVSKGNNLTTLRGPAEFVSSIAVTPEGHIIAGYDGGVFAIWDITRESVVKSFEPSTNHVRSISLNPDGTQLASGGMNAGVKIWDVSSGQLIRTLSGTGDPTHSVTFSRTGSRLASGSSNGSVHIWDTRTGLAIHSLRGHNDPVGDLEFSPDETRVVAASHRHVAIWDVVSGQMKWRVQPNHDPVGSVTFSRAGDQILIGGQGRRRNDSNLKLLDADSGKITHQLQGHYYHDQVKVVRTAPDGLYYLSGASDGTLRLWDAETRALVRLFEGHSYWVLTAAFSHDGNLMVSAGFDRKLRLWHVPTGAVLRVFEGHTGTVRGVALSPDGRRVFSGSADSTIRIWDVATGSLLATMMSGKENQWLVITPEGFFGGSPDAGDLLAIVQGRDVYSIDQFYQQLYRPDLVREKLAGDPSGKVKSAATELNLQRLLKTGKVPRVKIISHKPSDTAASDSISVAAMVTDQGGGRGRAEWRINGITHGIADPVDEHPKQTFSLDPGENVIQLVAYNGQNLVASPPATVRIFWNGLSEPTAPPRLHVLTIGINEYWDSNLRLTYAVPDARTLARTLQRSGAQHYEAVITTEVLDEDVTTRNLDAIFRRLSQQIRFRDVFVMFVAGHGVTRDGRYSFLPHDFKHRGDSSFATGGIGQDQWQAWLAKISAKKSVIIFDTCESGSLADMQMAFSRGGLERLAAVGKLIKATGRTTITASLADQPAQEGFRGHGVLTFALLDALGRGDRNGNGFIEVTELIEHVDDFVPEISQRAWGIRQVPRSLFQGTNFALVRQLPGVLPAVGEEAIIATKPTHVNSEFLRVFRNPDGGGDSIQDLPPFTIVTLVRVEGGWSLIAKDGNVLGYVIESKLHKLNELKVR